MQRLLNDEWSFAKMPLGSTYANAEQALFHPVDLPHDFLISNAGQLYESCDGWYRRTLHVPADKVDMCWLLRFDGVYMDCDVLLNGSVVCTHHYGYTAFDVPLSEALHAGDNEVMVHIRHRSPNSRWYSGAGIFRDVTLHVLPKAHLALDGVYVHSSREADGTWLMTIETEVVNPSIALPLTHRLYDHQRQLVAQVQAIADGERHTATLVLSDVRLWSVDDPYCYTLETCVPGQTICQHAGFRTTAFDPELGFLLNGRQVKLHGVCLHHDLGALGAAFHEKAARRQLRAMQDMGVNALRTTHNPPARQVLDLCDEMGIVVIDEFLDMWEMRKTDFDYARFFGTDVEQDAASWIRRDRNHPCVVMWSIGNEIPDTNYPRGAEITTMLKSFVERHDPFRNGVATIGSNYMPWQGAQDCAEILKIAGYNYGEKYYDQHHCEHPDWVIYGSETASSLSSRGIYHFPADTNILTDEDLQCSSLGNAVSAWGCRDLREMIVEDLKQTYSMGQFIWSGIDYIGEPTPYHTRSCYFGHMDTAVFPKDGFYQFRSLWTDKPMVHIGVYWDWNEGQLIDVPVMTSGASCELLLNGVSLGVKRVSRIDWKQSLPMWRVPYEPGDLCARAYDEDGRLIAEDHALSFGNSERIMLRAEDPVLLADGHDMTFITITMVDASGRTVENAIDRVHVSVTGSARLLGLDNGDSTDRDGYKTTTRRLFSGKLLAMVGALDHAGDARIEVTSPGKALTVLTIPVFPAARCEGRSCVERIASVEMPQEKPIRRIDMKPLSAASLSPDHRTVTFAISTEPRDAAPQPLYFRVTNSAGIDTPCARVTDNGDGTVTVEALGDGDIYLRGTCRNGYDHTRIISQQEIHIEGMGMPYLDAYSFIAGGLHDLQEGDIGSGNDQGLTFARDGYSMAGFRNVDFGAVGSDEITLPIFALDGNDYPITVYLGDPREGGRELTVLHYCKPSIWNTYQAETYTLPERITGVQTLCFSMDRKVHLKGFVFTKQSRAWRRQSAADADHVSGDSFRRCDDGILDIGNNVSIVYEHVDFEGATEATLTLDGSTPLDENPVTVHIQCEDGTETRALCRFAHAEERTSQSFRIGVNPGVCKVTFVFLPGSRFDFYGYRFER